MTSGFRLALALVVLLLGSLSGCDEDEPVLPADPQPDLEEDILVQEDLPAPDLPDPDLSPPEDTGPDAPEVEDCMCPAGEVCVSNDLVKDACFPRDCDDQRCDGDEVCFQGDCVAESCAGVDCGGYPNVCRGGVCEVGNCTDPDVQCPDGRACVENDCLLPCDEQADCDPLACRDGYCRPCELDQDCGGGLICVAEQCVDACSPGACLAGEVCDAESGRCVDACQGDADCDTDELCDLASGECGPADCAAADQGQQGACESGEVCVDRRCLPTRAPLVLGLCSGCGAMRSERYRAVLVLSPVEQSAPPAASARYRLESGAVQILQEGDTP